MARHLDQERCEVWRKRIEAQQQGGVTVAELCRREGVSTASFYAWKRKLRKQPFPRPKARDSTASTARRRSSASATASGATFVQLPLPAVPVSPWIEVVLAEGTVVRIGQQDLAALQTVLRALKDAASAPAMGEVRYA